MPVNVIYTLLLPNAPRFPCPKWNYNNTSAFVSPGINIPEALQLLLARGILIYFNSILKNQERNRQQGRMEGFKSWQLDPFQVKAVSTCSFYWWKTWRLSWTYHFLNSSVHTDQYGLKDSSLQHGNTHTGVYVSKCTCMHT